jgi:phenylacetate-coenzyme A ligase PaaK-like adenylate-forming protein
MQVIQERSDYVRILVLPTHEFNDADRQQILTNARLKIPESMEVVIEIVDELVRTEQMKTPFVIRRMSSEGTR